MFGVLPGRRRTTSSARWRGGIATSRSTNATDYSFFRDDASSGRTRRSPISTSTPGLRLHVRHAAADGRGRAATYARHLKDSLFGFGAAPAARHAPRVDVGDRRARPGGDARFDRHILNARGYLALSDRTRCSSMRGLFGCADGDAADRAAVRARRHRQRARLRVQGGGGHGHGADQRRVPRRPRPSATARITTASACSRFYDAGRDHGAARRIDRDVAARASASASAPAACASNSASAPTTSRSRARSSCASRRHSAAPASADLLARAPRAVLGGAAAGVRARGASSRSCASPAAASARRSRSGTFSGEVPGGARSGRRDPPAPADRAVGGPPGVGQAGAARGRLRLPDHARSGDAAVTVADVRRSEPAAGVAGAADAARSISGAPTRSSDDGAVLRARARHARDDRREGSRRRPASAVFGDDDSAVSLAGDGEDALSRRPAGQRLPAERVSRDAHAATSSGREMKAGVKLQ